MFTKIILGDLLTTYLIDVEEDIGIGRRLGNLDSTVMNCEKKNWWVVSQSLASQPSEQTHSLA